MAGNSNFTLAQRAKAAKMLYAQTMPPQQQHQQQTNHYIEDFNHQSRVVPMTSARGQRSMMPLPGGGGAHTVGRTRMELASQPPPSHNVYHNFPHIIIGGQPFYLIPSDPEDCAAFETGDPAYAYPQNVAPIYEEIDPDHEESQRPPVPGPVRVQSGSSEYSSAQSDQGEAGSDTGSHLQPQPRAFLPPQGQGRLVINPMEQGQNPALRRLPPHRSPASSTGSSSMYYYSDTMKAPRQQQQRGPPQQQQHQRLSDDFSDSGFSNRSNSRKMERNSVKQCLGSSSSNSDNSHVDTKVVVVEEDEDGAGSTLV